MTIQYAVTYEFETRPPQTHRGEMTAWSEPTCIFRAVKEAKKALRPIGWTSMNCVVLERKS